MTTATGVASAVASARDSIAAACARASRSPDDVRLIAVTKGFGDEAVKAAVAAGVTDIGENRLQEAHAKAGPAPRNFHLHCLGHLQSNKLARAAALFDAVHSVDSAVTARTLGQHRPYDADPLALLVQVDYTGSATRSGAREEDVAAIVRDSAGVGGIHIIGLMTIAAPGDADVARATFARLRTLRDEVSQGTGWDLPELSMGMSDDFEIAVEEGATMVRLGRRLFGTRI